MTILSKIFGDASVRFVNKLKSLVEKINELEKDCQKIELVDFSKKTKELKKRIENGEILDDILPEAFALVREAAVRTLNQRHFDEQILGAICFHQGKIAEMKTGEGKTLAATMAVYLNALTKKGVHVVTVNDYLSRRDAVWMGQIYNFLGLTVGCINHEASYLYDASFIKKDDGRGNLDEIRDEVGGFKVVHEFLHPCSRKEAYGADITYGTNNEFGFDYLRDNMAYQPQDIVQRNHYYAIVDEIDSILIDEARTPLIISAPDEESADLYKTFAVIAPRLKEEEHYTIDEKQRAVSVTEKGIEKAEELLGIGNIYTEKGIKYVHHLNQALRAQALFKKDKQYVVKNGEIIIVDEFTGRMMPGRRWSEGLHQAVEAKEGVQIQKESRTFASITFQNYFRMYEKLGGMTGTALTSAEEFYKVYNLEVVPIPTHRPLVRQDKQDIVYSTENAKFKAIVEEIKNRNEKGQPVLVGTVSIDKNEYLSGLLRVAGVPHKVLNAKHHEEEGEIIAQAGRKGGVTVATNMAGRGVDIVLGGNPPMAGEADGVRKAGGLYVIGTERHEARRIDNQLRGRAGRQGDSGESRFFVSLEDDLMRIFGSEKLKNIMMALGIPEDQPIEKKMISNAIESAQSKIEGLNFDSRKHLLEYDDVLNKQREKIYKLRRKIIMSGRVDLEEIIRGLFSAEGGSPAGGGHSVSGGDKEGVEYEKFLEKSREWGGEKEQVFWQNQRITLMRVIDMLWVGHLEAMDYMRSSVNLRAYGNRDPLVEYKNESVRLFRDLNRGIGAMFINVALNAPVGGGNVSMRSNQVTVKSAVFGDKKIGRNDSCPCGAKKTDGTPVKYKYCHGK